jgi:alkylation response protein AidB-like acyl-CoA dehydrogenase
MTPAELRGRVEEFLAAHPPASTERSAFLHARYAAGLAWVFFPSGHGGLGLSRGMQPMVDALFEAAGAPDNNRHANGIGLGMVAPTLLAYGTEEQRERFLEPLWCGEEIWCQLFSEPGAGSDLAGLATRAVPDGEDWVVNGQKVWTSGAHNAHFAILVARTDADVPKHRGITYFLADMGDPGVDVRPLRQITGEAEFNEVFLTDVRIPDTRRVGDVGDGWRVANGTLNNERVAIGGSASPREGGMLGVAASSWRSAPSGHTPELLDRLMRLYVEAEVARLTGQRLRQQLAAGQPGPAGSTMKLTFARLNQQLSGLDLEIRGEDGLRYSSEPGWEMIRPPSVDFTGRDAVYRYLRAKGNSIEGGTSEILRNIVAERVLGLPSEPRVDKDVPWKEVPR